MKRKDYMVSYEIKKGYPTEEICSTLKEARQRAKQISKEKGEARIEKWYEENGDMVIDDYFEIVYENGKEIK